MICIVNVVPEVVKNETKGVAVTGAQAGQPDNLSACRENENFGDKLKECEAEGLVEKKLEKVEKGDADKEDNGMPDPGTEVSMLGIAGILEGFEPPGYQSVNTVLSCEGKPEQEDKEFIPSQAYSMVKDAVKQAGHNQNGLTKQIAWMLQMDQNGKKPAPTQDEILKIIDGYLDSLENTSTDADETAVPQATLTGQKGQTDADGTSSINLAVSISEKNAAGTGLEKHGEVLAKSAAGETSGVFTAPEADTANTEASKDVNAGIPDTKAAKGTSTETDIKNASIVMDGSPEATTGAERFANAVTETHGAQVEDGAVKENIIRIVDSISTKTSEGQCDFDIELKPEFLGKVNIRLSMKDGSVKVQIRAHDIEAKEMLSAQTSGLQDMLKEKGIPISGINVIYEDSMPDLAGQAFRQQSGETDSGRDSYYDTETDDNIGEYMGRYDFYYGDSNVEFLA